MQCPDFITGGQKWTRYHISTFLLTFFSYALFHCVRKSFANVKSSMEELWLPANISYDNPNFTDTKTWAPNNRLPLFTDESDAERFLGILDAAFLASYAIGLYISGVLGDRLDPRLVLSCGMILSGVTCIMFGTVSEILGIYHKAWYMLWWTVSGFVQSSGWPAEVAVMGSWFSRDSRGLVLGLWAACASIGNIIGSHLASMTINYGYEYVFLTSGILLIAGAIIVYFGLVSKPELVGLESPSENSLSRRSLQSSGDSGIHNRRTEHEAISIVSAILLPGVIAYSLAYACLKLVNYSFFFWLPFYLKNRYGWDESMSDELSTWYDWGGIVGGLVIGVITDHQASRSPLLIGSTLAATASLFWYKNLPKGTSQNENALVMTVCGFFIGGPANVISAAVAADLGRQPAVAGNAEALATVTGIVDGTGSAGASLGQLLVPAIHSGLNSWDAVFYLFIIMTIMTGVCLLRLTWREYKQYGFCRRPVVIRTYSSDERNLIENEDTGSDHGQSDE